jgi:hypothetical protein
VVSKGLATMREIQEYYGMEDVLDMAEIIYIDAYNQEAYTDANSN